MHAANHSAASSQAFIPGAQADFSYYYRETIPGLGSKQFVRFFSVDYNGHILP